MLTEWSTRPLERRACATLGGPLMASPSPPAWLSAALRAHWRAPRWRVWAVLLIAVAAVAAFVPLFDRLGFGFSFVMALAASAAGLDLGAALVRRVRVAARAAEDGDGNGDGPPGPALLWHLWTRAQAQHLALLLPPLAVICVNALRVQNCDFGFGFQAYLLMPALSSAAATSIGLLLGLVLPAPRGRARYLLGAVPVAVLLLAVGYSLWRFYANPPVFSYNLFAGYFPGNLYDEQLDFGAPFYWARAAQLATLSALALLAAWRLDGRSLRLRWRPASPAGRARALVLAAAATAAASWLLAQGGERGFLVAADDIKAALGARYDTEHFTIYYPPGGAIERDIHIIAEDHEFRYAQAVAALGATPRGRITSFYFATPEDKFFWMGARYVYMAKPWRDEIYLHHQPFPHQTLRHEIAHAVTAAFGSPVFRVSAASWLGLPLLFNVGLIEGAAVAADWPGDYGAALTPHQAVKAMQELGMAPPPEQVLSTGFLAFSSARSYTLAGSLVRHLLQTGDRASLQTLYRSGGDFAAAYGVDQEQALGAWEDMISDTTLPPRAAEIVRERFRRPGIFSRVCPHAIARARVRALEEWRRGAFGEALDILATVCRQAPQEPRYRLEYAAYLSAAGDLDAAAAIYRALAEDAEAISSSLRAEALMALAGLSARAGDWPGAIAELERAIELPLEEDLLRNAVALRHAASHAGPAGTALRHYFWGSSAAGNSDPLVYLGHAAQAVAAEPSLGMGHYLFGRNLIDRGVPKQVAASLSEALDLGLHPLVAREAARGLAAAAYLAGDVALVERAASVLSEPEQPLTAQLYGADWLARLHWRQTGSLR